MLALCCCLLCGQQVRCGWAGLTSAPGSCCLSGPGDVCLHPLCSHTSNSWDELLALLLRAAFVCLFLSPGLRFGCRNPSCCVCAQCSGWALQVTQCSARRLCSSVPTALCRCFADPPQLRPRLSFGCISSWFSSALTPEPPNPSLKLELSGRCPLFSAGWMGHFGVGSSGVPLARPGDPR